MPILQAYLDESEREGGKFCVAGYIFAPAQAKKFVKDWSLLHRGLLPCHMTDLATGGGIYRGIRVTERNRLLRRSIDIINRRISMCVIISCDLREFEKVAPPFIRSFRSAYAVCSHLAMQRVGMWLDDSGRRDKVAYVLESGADHAAEADALIRAARRDPSDPYRYSSHAFVPKSQTLLLQAADILAWEWTKFMDETVEQRIRPSRLSFRALMHKYPGRYVGTHLTGEPLRQYMDLVKQLGLAEMAGHE